MSQAKRRQRRGSASFSDERVRSVWKVSRFLIFTALLRFPRPGKKSANASTFKDTGLACLIGSAAISFAAAFDE